MRASSSGASLPTGPRLAMLATASLAVCAVAGIACSPSGDPGQASDRPRNLIVISIDTLRADHLGVYGYPRPTSPSIDALASRGTVFLDASATSPWTKPSHASLFTGLYPSRHGASSMVRAMAAEVPTLAEWLGRKGFHTLGVVNNDWLKVHGLERGFREFESVPYAQGSPQPSPVTPAAIRLIDRWDGATPLFAFIHYVDPHADYRSLPRYRRLFPEARRGAASGTTLEFQEFERGRFGITEQDVPYLKAAYDAGIRQVDDQLGELLAYLEEKDLLEDSLVVLTSDHGEEFLEHGGIHHGHTQFQEVIRIPLIFTGPGVPAGARVGDPVSLIDVMPTVLALLELPAPRDLDGVDLSRLWAPGSAGLAARTLFLESDCVLPGDRPGRFLDLGTNRAVRRGNFKYHLDLATGLSRLFDLSQDPGETSDVSAQHPGVARELADEMQRFLSRQIAPGPSRELDAAERERLKAMGYLQDE